MTRSLSLALAKEIALLSEPLSAKKAFEWRLINGCVPAEQLETVAAGVAQKLATLDAPSKGPAASGGSRDASARLGHIKGQLNAAWEQSMWQTFREEAALLQHARGRCVGIETSPAIRWSRLASKPNSGCPSPDSVR